MNKQFGRLCNLGVSSKAQVLVNLEDIVKMETALATQQEAQSFVMWLISMVFAEITSLELDIDQAAMF